MYRRIMKSACVFGLVLASAACGEDTVDGTAPFVEEDGATVVTLVVGDDLGAVVIDITGDALSIVEAGHPELEVITTPIENGLRVAVFGAEAITGPLIRFHPTDESVQWRATVVEATDTYNRPVPIGDVSIRVR